MATGGQESSEECVFRQHSATLIHAIDCPDLFAWQLCANDIISTSVRDKALVRELSNQEKNSILLSAVQGKIRAEPSVFRKFLQLLLVNDDLVVRNLGERLKATHAQALSTKQPTSKPPSANSSQQGSSLPPSKKPPPSNPPEPDNPLLEQYAGYLRSVYIRSELPQYDKWPPTQSTSYVSLAVISKENVTREEADEFTKATLHGDVDQILKKKGPIEMKDILVTETGQKPKCVLVEGGPGVGKTTFSWEVCRRWGKGELFQEYSIVVHLSLREEWVQSAKRATDLLYYTDEEVQQQIASEIVRTKGKGVLLVLDGLDELPSILLTKSSVVGRLLSGTDLPLATVLVTSRPSVTEKLRLNWRNPRHIEVLGFTKQDIQGYIRTVLPPNLLPGFTEYLSIYPHIHTMMYVPLNSAIVTEVYKHSQLFNKRAPTTTTQLYSDLSHTLLLRYLDNYPVYKSRELELNSFSDLPSPVLVQFQRLCEVAYKGVMSRQLSFSNLGQLFDHLGFMHSKAETFCSRGVSVTYNFLHFSIQEYLAAVHISQMELKERMELFKNYSTRAREIDNHYLDNVWRFVFGLTKLKHFNLTEVNGYLLSEGTGRVAARSIELLYETQDHSCLEIFGDSTVTFESRDSLQPNTSAGLAYCIINSMCTFRLRIYLCSDDVAEILVRGLKNCDASRTGCIHSICGHIRPQRLKEISTYILQGIQELDLDSIDWEAQTWKVLAEVIRCTTNLKVLTLSAYATLLHACPNGPSLVEVCSSLSTLDSLTSLSIRNCSITSENGSSLKHLLQTTHSLEYLEVSPHWMSHNFSVTDVSKGQAHIAEALSINQTLTKVSINLVVSERSSVGTELTKIIKYYAKALSENKKLQEFDMRDSDISTEGAVAMVEMLDVNQQLVKLTLPHNTRRDRYHSTVRSLGSFKRNSHRILLCTA